MKVEYKEGCECCSVSSSSISSVSSSSVSAASVDSTPISSVSSASESSASSSSLSSASESPVTPCDCACCIEEDIKGKFVDESSAANSCNLGTSATFTLSYGSGAEPSTGVAAGESVGSWWRGSVTYCGGTTKVVVYCLETKGGCDNFYAYIEYDLPDCLLALTNGNETSHIRSGTSVACTCRPLSVKIGAFAGVGDNDSGCCCEGCDPTDASDCDFSFRLELTE